MPKPLKTPTRTFRCADDIWNAAKEKAHADGMTLTDVLITALLSYIED